MGKRGLLVVVSAPSGGGKTSVIKKVLESGNGNFRYAISATTRSMRANEQDGKDYHFLSLEDFERKRANGEFVEWAEVHGQYYATLRGPLEQWMEEGRVVFLDLDVDGGLAVKKRYKDAALLVFIKPPSFESLVARLKSRKTETEAQIRKRLQRYPKEMKKSAEYDYGIVNEDLEGTAKEILALVEKHIQPNRE